MSDEDYPVCPNCGTAAEQNQFCSKCGLNLTREKRLPLASHHAERMRKRREASEAAARRGADPLNLTGVTQWTPGSRVAGDRIRAALAADERVLGAFYCSYRVGVMVPTVVAVSDRCMYVAVSTRNTKVVAVPLENIQDVRWVGAQRIDVLGLHRT